jgi:hypothetical protein
MSFRQGAKIGIGNVQDATRLFFTKEEVKQRWESRQERRIDSLGRWHVAAALRTGEVAVDVQLKDSRPLQYIELFLNEASDGSTSGTWSCLYSRPHEGSELDLKVEKRITPRGPGQYRLALNVRFTDGTTCYWYSQPPHILRLES